MKSQTIIFLILLCVLNLGFQQRKKLTENEVVQKAEEFIAQQGYTNLSPIKDKTQWSPDSVMGVPDEYEMEIRSNSILPKAYGITKVTEENPYIWAVVFRYNPNCKCRKFDPHFDERIKRSGPVVIMDKYGNNIKMEHQESYLEFKGLKKLNKP